MRRGNARSPRRKTFRSKKEAEDEGSHLKNFRRDPVAFRLSSEEALLLRRYAKHKGLSPALAAKRIVVRFLAERE